MSNRLAKRPTHLERTAARKLPPLDIVLRRALQKLPHEMLGVLLRGFRSIPDGEVHSVKAALAAIGLPDRDRLTPVWEAALTEAVQEVAQMI